MHSRQRHLALAGVLLVALTGCGGPSATLGDAIPAVGGAPRAKPIVVPEIGECRVLDSDAILASSDNTPASDCSEEHTALTYATGDVEDKIPFDEAIKKTCAGGYPEALGLTQEQANLTIFSWAWYQPSPREYAEGVRSYRCELVATNTGDGDPVPLPQGGLPLIRGDRVTDAYALCRTDESTNVPCTAPHAWRASGTFQGTGNDYPSNATVQKWAEDKCPDLVTTKNFLYSWPGSGSWTDYDDHTIYCWSTDTQS